MSDTKYAGVMKAAKDVLQVLDDFKKQEAPIAKLNAEQRGKEHQVITAVGAKVADMIEGGQVQVDADLKDILVKLNRSGGIATIGSQGFGDMKQKPYVELFIWRNDVSVLEKLALEDNVLLVGANRDERGYKAADNYPLTLENGKVTRSLQLWFDHSDDRYFNRHTKLSRKTGMPISYDMKGLRFVTIVWTKASDLRDFVEILKQLL